MLVDIILRCGNITTLLTSDEENNMSDFNLVLKAITLSNEAKYLIEFHPELAKYASIQNLVKLAKQWTECLDKEVQS